MSGGAGKARIVSVGIGESGREIISQFTTTDSEGISLYGTDSVQLSPESEIIENIVIWQIQRDPTADGAVSSETETKELPKGIDVAEALTGADVVFIVTSFESEADNIYSTALAKSAKALGALTLAIIARPEIEDGSSLSSRVESGINGLITCVDSLLLALISNNAEHCSDTGIATSTAGVEGLLPKIAMHAISDLVRDTHLVSVDLADVRTVMGDRGLAVMGVGMANGRNRAVDAAKAALGCELLHDVDLTRSYGVVVNISGADITLAEFSDVYDLIESVTSENTITVVGDAIDTSIADKLRVTAIFTGIKNDV